MVGGGVLLVTGIQAAGKSTVAQIVAERLDRSVHVRGDLFRRMVVRGRVEMESSDPQPEAIRQLELRYELAATVADRYAEAGFAVVWQDIVLGRHLPAVVGMLTSPRRHVVVLAPSVAAVRARDAVRRAERGKVAYREGDEGIEGLDRQLREGTPRVGLWLDSSDQTPEETAEEILERVWRRGEGRVPSSRGDASPTVAGGRYRP